jgi:pyridoxamine 5'-phosphate oxidase
VDIDDLDADPFATFARWLHDAVAADLWEPTAMNLSTAGADAHPRGRHVLLKGHGPDGFVWFTNYESTKGQHLAANPWACLTFPWFALKPARQVVVEGPVERTSADESDAYFASRDRNSQLGAWASEQSREIPDRAYLEDRFAALERHYPQAVPRPPHWGGYRLRPVSIELWQGRPNRLHDRFRYTLEADGTWRLARLAP